MNAITEMERDFYYDIDNAASRWPHTLDDYHEDEYYCVNVTFEEEDWGYCADEMWRALCAVCDDYGCQPDSDGCTYRMALREEKEQ